ncbi:hypothetical protein PG637_04235 [Riemerella anatipestifer]|nr:hypothetical protein [Riemerella anatipestifer]
MVIIGRCSKQALVEAVKAGVKNASMFSPKRFDEFANSSKRFYENVGTFFQLTLELLQKMKRAGLV